MMNKNERMNTLKQNGYDTSKFFNLNMDIPVGAKVEIKIDGVPYSINSIMNNDTIVKGILDNGYVFNSRTDGRFIVAQTFKMLNEKSYNHKLNMYEYGWDAYLRNSYGYMYQFDMMLDEVHKLAKMEKSNDPDFVRLSSFFTKDVVFETCNHYMRQLKKYIKNQKHRKCKGIPYVKLAKYGNVFLNNLDDKVYNKLYYALTLIRNADSYKMLEDGLKLFMDFIVKLPYTTPKSSVWKTAFKGKGAYVTLLNIVKFHNVTVENYETGEKLDRDDSVAYIESLLNEYKGEYWKYHELLKKTIADNSFDLRNSIEANK